MDNAVSSNPMYYIKGRWLNLQRSRSRFEFKRFEFYLYPDRERTRRFRTSVSSTFAFEFVVIHIDAAYSNEAVPSAYSITRHESQIRFERFTPSVYRDTESGVWMAVCCPLPPLPGYRVSLRSCVRFLGFLDNRPGTGIRETPVSAS